MAENREHAVLSASGAHKWLKCTPSARLEEQFPNQTSEYMKEGTLAHAIAEYKVKSYFLEPISKTAYTKRINKFKKEEDFSEEMLHHTDTYLEFIKGETMQTSERPFIAVEQKIDFSKYVPDGFGTADCILISNNVLQIIDFKYGKGVLVEAEENPQMKLYALGALEQFGLFYDIRKIKMTIVQPRLDSISTAEITREELVKWGNETVVPQAQKAFMGIGDFVQGEHCRFCKAKGACEFRAKENMKIVERIKKQDGILSNVELGKILTDTENIAQWIKDTQEYALSQILKGEEVPGWKAVEGKSNRKITDIDKAFEILEANGIDEAMLYERNPLTLTKLEKVVGKSKLTELIGDHIEKPKGAPTLAKENDKRKEYIRSTALEDFGKVGI